MKLEDRRNIIPEYALEHSVTGVKVREGKGEDKGFGVLGRGGGLGSRLEEREL